MAAVADLPALVLEALLLTLQYQDGDANDYDWVDPRWRLA